MPRRYPGAFRRVYPGFVQLAAFMSMNIERHVKAHRDLYDHLARGEHEKAQATQAFYDEYFAVLDLPAEFYLETVRCIFQEHALAAGMLDVARSAGRAARHQAHALLTVEGERDDICAVGQTARSPRFVLGAPAVPQATPHAGRCRALWRLQRQSLDQPDLSAGEECHPRERVRPAQRRDWPRSCKLRSATQLLQRDRALALRTIAAEPAPLAVNIERAALIIIDMQRDFLRPAASARRSATMCRG